MHSNMRPLIIPLSIHINYSHYIHVGYTFQQSNYHHKTLFPAALQPKSGIGRLVLMFIRRAQLETHTQPTGLLSTSDQPVAEAVMYKT